MIPVIIFYAHTIFAVYAFVRSYQKEGWLQAFLNIAFIIILFAVGWTICDLFVGFIISTDGYRVLMPENVIILFLLKISGFYAQDGSYVILTPKDSISLILLTFFEIIFYNFYFVKLKSAGTPVQEA
jgi:hypothetical protein